MERPELIDLILKELILADPEYRYMEEKWCREKFGVSDITLLEGSVDKLLELNYVERKNHTKWSIRINQDGRELIEKHGSYSSFLKSLDTATTKESRQQTANTILKIISALGVIWASVFTFLTFQKNEKIDRLETENITLQTTVDSLSREIEALRGSQFAVPSDSSTATETTEEKK